jgi:hypothetical protein
MLALTAPYGFRSLYMVFRPNFSAVTLPTTQVYFKSSSKCRALFPVVVTPFPGLRIMPIH